jgi:hypothetical protein
MPTVPGTTGKTLSFAQIEQLWIANGGDPAWAPTMAGIAIAESGGLTNNLNNNASTGDFSIGLWQINYFGALGPARAPRYGEPAALGNDPNAQAKAAVDILGGGGGITAWAGDTVGQLAQNGKPLSLAQVQAALPAAASNAAATAQAGDAQFTSWWSQILGAAAGAATGGGATAVAGPVTSSLGQWGTIITDLSSAAFWKRIGVFTLGGAVFGIGLVVFFVSTPEGKKVVSEGTQVAATAVLA